MGDKNTIPLLIVFCLRLMHRAVTLDHEAYLAAVKVRDEAVYDLLAAKVPPQQLVSPQLLPQQSFRRGHLPSHLQRPKPLPLPAREGTGGLPPGLSRLPSHHLEPP